MKQAGISIPVFAFAVVVGCSTSDAPSPGLVTADSAGIVLVENNVSARTPVCQVGESPSLTIGQGDGPPEYQLYRTFGAVRLTDGSIAVVNQGSQELRLYDSDGRFLKAAGGEGGGPGRFQNAFTLSITPGDTLWVGDYDPWEWEVFSPDGTWVRGVRPLPDLTNADVAEVLDSGMMVTAPGVWADAPVGSFKASVLTALLHSPEGTVIDTIGTFDDGRYGMYEDVPGFVVSPMFDSSSRISVGGTRIITAHTSRAELRVLEIDQEARLERIIRWDAPIRPVSDADVEAERTRILDNNAEVPEDMRKRLVDPQIREERPVAETFPVFSQIEIGRDDRIWVRTYQPPPGSDLREWLVFAPDGSLQCRVEVAAFEQMPDFGSDYILVMRRDELGIEQILLYQLGAPGPAEDA